MTGSSDASSSSASASAGSASAPRLAVSSLDTGYARALIELAEEAGRFDEVADELAQIRDLLEQRESLRRLIASRALTAPQRRSMLERLFKGRVCDLTYRFLQTINAKERLNRLPAICQAADALVDERLGRLDVEAYVAEGLDESRQREVADRIGGVLGKTVRLRQHVDESLIGGLKLRVGDSLFDGSVAAQLRRFRERMLSQAGRVSVES